MGIGRPRLLPARDRIMGDFVGGGVGRLRRHFGGEGWRGSDGHGSLAGLNRLVKAEGIDDEGWRLGIAAEGDHVAGVDKRWACNGLAIDERAAGAAAVLDDPLAVVDE